MRRVKRRRMVVVVVVVVVVLVVVTIVMMLAMTLAIETACWKKREGVCCPLTVNGRLCCE